MLSFLERQLIPALNMKIRALEKNESTEGMQSKYKLMNHILSELA